MREKQEVDPSAHLKEPESFDQTADLVPQGEDHCRLPSSLGCLPVSRFINGTEGRTPGLQDRPQTAVSKTTTTTLSPGTRPSQQVTMTTSTVGKSRRTRDKQANNSDTRGALRRSNTARQLPAGIHRRSSFPSLSPHGSPWREEPGG